MKSLLLNYEKYPESGVGDGYGGVTIEYKLGLDLYKTVQGGEFNLTEKENPDGFPVIQLRIEKGWFGKKSFILEFFSDDGAEESFEVRDIKEAIEAIYDSPIPKKWGWIFEIQNTNAEKIDMLSKVDKDFIDTQSNAYPFHSEEVDIKAELKKFKEMLDDGLIEQEDYDAKKKELLDLKS